MGVSHRSRLGIELEAVTATTGRRQVTLGPTNIGDRARAVNLDGRKLRALTAVGRVDRRDGPSRGPAARPSDASRACRGAPAQSVPENPLPPNPRAGNTAADRPPRISPPLHRDRR